MPLETEAGSRIAAVWEADLQIQVFEQWVTSLGVEVPTGWTLEVARDIRQVGDRVFICGFGTDPAGTTTAWLIKAPYQPIEPCPWDLDDSGDVGVTDLLDLLSAWGMDPGGPPDFDGDGNVGVTDLLELLANWGDCP